jgi:hypothetical protein
MKKKLVSLVICLTVLTFIIPEGVSAYSGSYSFDITWGVKGTKTHSLANKRTKTTVKAETYVPAGNRIKSSKGQYSVGLSRGLKTYKTSFITANGSNATRNFGTVTKNDYKVVVTKEGGNGGTAEERIKGNGNITQ